MKKLYIIRHAKSSWKDTTLSDFDRPLNKRGKHNSKFMGELLAQKNIKPDIILASSAKRAYSTAKNIAKVIGYSKQKIHFSTKMYESSISTLVELIRSIDNKNHTAFIIGHNPTLNCLLDALVPYNSIDNIVTAGVVELELDIDRWEDLSHQTTKLISFEYPKKYLTSYNTYQL